MYKQFIFDVDGTLIDTNEAIILGMKEAWEEKTGEKRSAEDFHFIIGIPGEVSLKKLGYEKGYVDFGRLWVEKIRAHKDKVRIFPGIKDVLEILKKEEVGLSVVTSRTRSELIEVFDAFDLWKYFDHTVTADMTQRHKPQPEPLLKLLEISGCRPQDALYIGDTAHDMTCAKKAGMDSALALWGMFGDSDREETYRLSKPEEILDLQRK